MIVVGASALVEVRARRFERFTLAEALVAPPLTRDAKLAASAGHDARVELLR